MTEQLLMHAAACVEASYTLALVMHALHEVSLI
jgi:hypothetical protein